ncbi:hypothetical protein [Parafrankia discariae]|uniref:hypothetical protein n=1 Tax=Parafrankia discariae TaxID=365528 RepID=UPI00035E1E04|nr:hypothetical protein [Parafrankia discariae]
MHEPSTGLLNTFYTTPRAGCARLSDGGGPFGFDITTALQIDALIRGYDCDAIIETGCYLGDTTEYLARQYPSLSVVTCDIIDEYATFTRQRLRGQPNTTVHAGDSTRILRSTTAAFRRPLIYLDAHWYADWPLRAELAAIPRGIVAIDDVDIGHPRFGYDTYAGQPCNPQLIASATDVEVLFLGDPFADYPYPCLQVSRRSGTAYLAHNLDATVLHSGPMFCPVLLRPQIEMPDWDTRHSRVT